MSRNERQIARQLHVNHECSTATCACVRRAPWRHQEYPNKTLKTRKYCRNLRYELRDIERLWLSVPTWKRHMSNSNITKVLKFISLPRFTIISCDVKRSEQTRFLLWMEQHQFVVPSRLPSSVTSREKHLNVFHTHHKFSRWRSYNYSSIATLSELRIKKVEN